MAKQHFAVAVVRPDGQADPDYVIAADPERHRFGDVRQHLESQGFQVLAAPRPIEVLPPSTTTTATSTLPAAPLVGNVADFGQVAGGVGGGMLGGLVGHPLAGAATGALVTRGLAGALGQQPSQGIGPVPPGQDFASRARREAGRGVFGEVFSAGMPYVAPLVGRVAGVPGFARRLLSREGSASLPELRTLAREGGGALPLPVTREALREAGASTTRQTLRAVRAAFGRAPTDPEVGPKAVAKGLSNLLGTLPNVPTTMVHAQGAGGRSIHVPTAAAVVDKVYAATGLRISELSEGQIAKLLREEPKRLVEAFRIVGTEVGGETGAALTRPLAESLVARASSRAIRRAPGGAFPGAVGGGILDPEIMLRELGALQKRLGEDGVRAVWGPTGMQKFRQVTGSLAGATGKLAPRGVRTDAIIRLLPLALAMAGGLEAGGHTGHLFALWAGAQGTKEMRDLLPRLLATEPGLRLVGAWIDGEARRVPDRLLVPMLQALARAVPGMVRSGMGGGAGDGPPMAPGVAGAFLPPPAAGGYGR